MNTNSSSVKKIENLQTFSTYIFLAANVLYLFGFSLCVFMYSISILGWVLTGSFANTSRKMNSITEERFQNYINRSIFGGCASLLFLLSHLFYG